MTLISLDLLLWSFVILSYSLMLICIGLGVLFGWRKGQNGILIRFAGTGIAALLAFIVTRLLRNAFSNLLSDLIFDILDSEMNTRTIERLIETAGSLSALIRVMIGALALPFVFTTLFVVFQLIATIVCSIVARKTEREEEKMGMLFGALRGVVIALVLLFPWISLRSYAETVISSHDLVKNAAYETFGEEQVETLKETISADVPYLLTRKSIVPVMVNSLSAVQLEDYKMTVYRAIEGIPVVVDAAELFFDNDSDFPMLDQNIRDDFDEVLTGVEDSEFLRHLLAELLVPAAEQWAKGRDFLNLSSPPLVSDDDRINNIYVNVYLTLAESDSQTIVKNLRTLLKVAGAIGDLNFRYQNRPLAETLMQDDNLDVLLGPLMENDNMKNVVVSIVDLSMRTFAENVFASASENAEEAYELFMDELIKIVNDSKNDVTLVCEELRDMANENGISIPEDVLQSFSEALVEKVSLNGGVLDETVMNELYIEFADKYAELVEAGDIVIESMPEK